MELECFCETGIWLTRLPGVSSGHLFYPDLLELLTGLDRNSGMISIKPQYLDVVSRAKERMVRQGGWKLAYMPMNEGYELKLFNMKSDPSCCLDVYQSNPQVVERLWSSLDRWIRCSAYSTENVLSSSNPGFG